MLFLLSFLKKQNPAISKSFSLISFFQRIVPVTDGEKLVCSFICEEKVLSVGVSPIVLHLIKTFF